MLPLTGVIFYTIKGIVRPKILLFLMPSNPIWLTFFSKTQYFNFFCPYGGSHWGPKLIVPYLITLQKHAKNI